MPYSNAPDPRIMDGFAALGDVIGGGPQQRAAGAYTDQLKGHGQAADAMWQARDARARAIAREGIRADVVREAMAGNADAQAALGAAALGTAASPNLSSITGGLGDFADMQIASERRAALEAGDVPRYNRLTAFETKKDYQPMQIEGGVAYADGTDLADAVFTPLPQTQAQIESSRAQAERTRANIGNDAARTQAAVDKANRPPAPRGGGATGDKPRTAKQAEDFYLEQARQLIADKRLSVEEAKQRLKNAGYSKAADRL